MKLNQIKDGSIPTFSEKDDMWVGYKLLFDHYAYKTINPLEVQQLERITINYLAGVKDATKPN